MSFRSRVVGTVAAVNLTVIALAFLAVAHIVNASQQRQFDDALQREALEEVSEIAEAGGEHLRISPRLGPSPDDIGPLTKYAVLYDAEGRVLDASLAWNGEFPAIDDLPSPNGNLRIHGQHLRGLVTEVQGHPGTLLLLAAPRDDLDNDARILSRALGLVFALAFVSTILLTSGVVRRLTRIHERIAQVVRRISDKDMTARVGEVRAAPEIIQLASDIDDMIGRIELLLRHQSEFITHAAHELRSPLATLYGELSHAVRRARDAEQYREAIEGALVSTRRLMALADDLLALARVGHVSESPRAPVNLEQICAEAQDMIGVQARAKDVRVAVQVEAMVVHGNYMDLARLVRNLLENAISHSCAGDVVEVEGRSEGSCAVLKVRDHGTGVSQSDAEQIFQPFFRGSRERASEHPGSGLGLAIALEITTQHGGTLELDPGPGPGACFVLRLPLEGAEAQRAPASRRS
ncbi:putative two-component sensor kinase [Enhygromyxa salina]|uniref:histidine kinase n=1 Tax=Enhygromyxa salina TaxID=215803 RepID=A0A0C2CVB5_9BACT|nr:HAMP domain-containing sensor histidine kinase [Enhygromyxa salina]KIG13525.1 putative two-component sensor kinase [Enhygromyxa salina]